MVSGRAHRRLPWIWTGFVTVVSLVLVLVGGYSVDGVVSLSDVALRLVLPIVFTAVGAVLATRQPGNRIAWIMFVVAVGVILDGVPQPLLHTEPATLGLVGWLALGLANTMWIVVLFPLLMLLYLFPSGRFLNPRWTWAGWLAGVLPLGFFLVGGFTEQIGPPEGTWLIDNPVGYIPNGSPLPERFVLVFTLGILVLAAGGLVAVVVRYRRSEIVGRTQIKWVLYAIVMFAAVFAVTQVAPDASGAVGVVIDLLFDLSLILIPISITAAITRYRLFDIDRIASRTFTYAVVVALLAALYFGMVTVIAGMLPTQNAIAVAVSTLAAAALFNPLRRRVQGIVDRRFNRSAYRAEQVSEAFGARLRVALTVEELSNLWNHTAVEVFQPSLSAIWVNQEK